MDKKIALVTGASRGIGAEIARSLAQNGYYVFVNYNTSESLANAVVDEIRNSGNMAETIKCDVSKPNEVKVMFEYIRKCYGKLDLLVNNAGISITGFFQDLSDDDWHKIIDVNLSSVFYCSREAIKIMLNNNSGKIINISSMWGLVGGAMEVHYSATKAGVIGLSKALAKEVAPSGITVNVVAPGSIGTDMLKMLGEDTIEYIKDDIPLGKIGTAQDVANAVCFLASDKADYITGQVISVNGGMVI